MTVGGGFAACYGARTPGHRGPTANYPRGLPLQQRFPLGTLGAEGWQGWGGTGLVFVTIREFPEGDTKGGISLGKQTWWRHCG